MSGDCCRDRRNFLIGRATDRCRRMQSYYDSRHDRGQGYKRGQERENRAHASYHEQQSLIYEVSLHVRIQRP